MRLPPLLLLLFGLAPVAATAQVRDDFSDGDFTQAPAWTGDAGWTIAAIDGNLGLHTDGLAASDTLVLATPSLLAFGHWDLRLSLRGVNLSTFNGLRVYLTADAHPLEGALHGYYLQLGTNNLDAIQLFRQDGPPDQRVELGRSEGGLLAGDGHALRLGVLRGTDGSWQVLHDGAPLFSAHDAAYDASLFFGLWVRHTRTTSASYAFDDVDVGLGPLRADTTAPRLRLARYRYGPPDVEITFTEPVLPDDLVPSAFEVVGGASPVQVLFEGPAARAALLRFAAPLPVGHHRLRTAGLRDRAGNARPDTTILLVGADPAPGDVVVNEVLFAPGAGTPEFVELLNRSALLFDVARFAITDALNRPEPAATTPTALSPGAYAVLTPDAEALSVAFPDAGGFEPAAWPSLNDSGDTVGLLFEGTVLDRLVYTGAGHPAGRSLERVDPAGPADLPGNFLPSAALVGATPGQRNSVYHPDTLGPRLLFAEEEGARSLRAFFDEPLDLTDIAPQSFRTGGQVSLEATPLTDTILRLVFAHDLFSGSSAGAPLIAANVADRTGNRRSATSVQPARRGEEGDLAVNEVLFAPRADPFDSRPDQPEYVELVNTAPYSVSLHGLYWTDRPDEQGRADTLQVGAGARALPPAGVAVVYAARGGDLLAAFPGVGMAAEALLLPIDRSSLGLRNTGDLLRLHRRDGGMLEAAPYGPDLHHPALADDAGIALERLRADLPATDPANWTSSPHPSGGTPGAPNAARLPEAVPATRLGLTAAPTPFSPDGDGRDDAVLLHYRLGQLTQGAGVARVRIFDAQGRLVRTLAPALLSGPEGALIWDGRGDGGRTLRPGIYIVLLEAADAYTGRAERHKAAVVLARPLR